MTFVDVERASGKVSNGLAFLGILGMVAVSMMTTFDVVIMRWLMNSPISGSNELLSTIFAVSVAFVLPGALARKASLEVDILANLTSASTVALLRQIGHALLLLLVILLAWRVSVYTITAFERGQATVILLWVTWPFLSFISLAFMICIPVQFIAFLSTVRSDASLSGASPGRRAIIISLAVMLFAAVIYVAVERFQPVVSLYPIGTSLIMFVLLWVLILLMIPVAVVLVFCGLVGTAFLMGVPTAMSVLGSETVGLITSHDLAVIPLFLLMGGFATAAGMSKDIYRLAQASFGFMRGGLAHATIGGCAGFGALTGSSVATVLTMGKFALPEMRARGYDRSLSAGCVAAGGTLGQLVPPSTAIVLYALLTEQSIGRMYIAVLVPALLTILLYMIAVSITVRISPNSAPGRQQFKIQEFGAALSGATIVLAMFVIVIGGIYAGIFTVTEAASVGAAIAFFAALFRGKLKGRAILEVASETTTSTGLIYFVIIGAFVATFFMGTSGLPDFLIQLLTESNLQPIMIILLLVAGYIALGCVMDSFTIMIITAPLVAVIIAHIGYDLVWWGVLMVVLVELGLITPPFGLNLFIMRTVDPSTPLSSIFAGATPFVLADIVKIVLLIAFPWLVLWLPQMAFQ